MPQVDSGRDLHVKATDVVNQKIVNFIADLLTCCALIATIVVGAQILIDKAKLRKFSNSDVAKLATLVVVIGFLVWLLLYTGGSVNPAL